MTMPDERRRAVAQMEEAALDLVRALARRDPGDAVVEVDRAAILRLSHALRHYPTACDMGCTALALPELWR